MPMASESKKCHLDPAEFSLPKRLLINFTKAFISICSFPETNVNLVPLVMLNSNATNSSSGMPFSKAYCDAKIRKEGFMFGNVFQRGLKIAEDFLNEELPGSRQEQHLLGKLLQFIKEEGKIEVDLHILSKAELVILLTNHLFGKLSTAPFYTIDRHYDGKVKQQCPCNKAECKFTGEFGDTSMGNGEVWHGHVDIINRNDLVIDSLDENPQNLHGKLTEEVNSKNPEQILAEVIVFSFLQKQRHPERDNFLTPCIGVGSSELLVALYDPEHDVLLESSKVPLFDTKTETDQTGPKKFSLEAIIVSWLVVNYKFLCTGLTEKMLTCKANFYEIAKDKIEIYEKNLSLGNVCTSCVLKKSKVNWYHDPVMLEKYINFSKHYEKITTNS